MTKCFFFSITETLSPDLNLVINTENGVRLGVVLPVGAASVIVQSASDAISVTVTQSDDLVFDNLQLGVDYVFTATAFNKDALQSAETTLTVSTGK